MLLLVWAGAFSAAVAAGVLGPLGGLWGDGVAAVAALAAAGLLWRRHVALAGAVASFGLGLVLGAAEVTPPALDPALRAALDGGRPVDVVANVDRGPEPTGSGLRLQVSLRSLDGRPAAGRCALRIARGDAPDLLPGDGVRFEARLHEPRGLANFGLPDTTLVSRAAGIVALAGVRDAGRLRREPSRRGGPRAWALRARHAMRQALDAGVSPATAALLRTMVLGERSGLPERVEDGFRAAGATHALSVSGLHLAAVAAVFYGGVRRLLLRLPRLPLWLNPAALAAALAVPAIAFYAMLTGEAVATLRSALMVAGGLAAIMVRRRVSSYAAIGAAALVLLLPAPLLLFDVSFQLTFASVAAIALLARRLGPTPDGSDGGRRGRPALRGLRWLWRYSAVTLAATAGTAPLVAHAFGELTPAALPGNLILVPLVELAVVPLGLAGAGLAALYPVLGAPLLALASLAARFSMIVAEGFRLAAPVWLVRSPDRFETAALTVGGMLALAGLRARRRGRRLLVVGVLLLGGAFASMMVRELARRADPDVRVTFLDVGQGDALLLELPGGKTVLVDGGGAYDASFDPGARVVEPFLRAHGITSLDVVALTHAHPDHLNGLVRILQRFPVGALWVTQGEANDPVYARLLHAAAVGAVPVGGPSPMVAGGAQVTPLGPWVDGRIAAPPGLSTNNASLVLRVAFAGRAVLLTGDIDEEGEGELIGHAAASAGRVLASDVVKVPHHGSRTSCGAELLDAVAPRWAVISVGWQNRYGFPSNQVLARLSSRSVRVLRTDQHGAVAIRLRADGNMEATCARGCR